jgi:hypothetical protein
MVPSKASLSHLARRLERVGVRAAMAVAPRRPHVVISGFPVDEGNAVEMVRAVAARYPGDVYWLVPDEESGRRVLDSSGADPDGRVTLLPHRSFTAVSRFATAEVSMFTHGVFGNPKRVRRKTMVNLWHGGGFKGAIMCDAKGRPAIHSDYLVAATEQFGTVLAGECALPDGGLLLTGNPRIDQFHRLEGLDLARLGIEPASPFILWMPTFRRNRGLGLTVGWSDVDAGGRVDVNSAMASSVEVLQREFGLQVVIKPHPQDAESRAIPGAVVVTNDDLRMAGIQLYQLIGASSGLLTDYSSVWIDYLSVDRPIAFVVPDEAGYTAGRGFNPPDALDWLPGPRIATVDDARAFAEDVLAGGVASRGRRCEVAEHVGLAARDDVANTVLEMLAERGVFAAPLRPRP